MRTPSSRRGNRQFALLRHSPCVKKRQMATPDGRLGGESGADGSSVTLSLDTSGTSSALIWAKGQWAPFRQPLAKKTQGVCARPGLEVPAARGLAEDRPAPVALAAPGAPPRPGAARAASRARVRSWKGTSRRSGLLGRGLQP